MTYINTIPSPLGELYLSSDGANITGLWMEGQKYYASTLDANTEEKELPVFDQLKKWLTIYFSGKQPDFLPPLVPRGSDFRRSVWDILLDIPYGKTITYGEIAKKLEESSCGKQSSARAVGGAVGHNPISILIPCHRVVGANGSLTGYAGGMEKKLHLLNLEGASGH